MSTRGDCRNFTTSTGTFLDYFVNVVYRHKHVEAPKPGEGLVDQLSVLTIDYP
jgi:hypothetical protein